MRRHAGSIVLVCILVSIGCASANVDLGWKSGWSPADTTKTDLLASGGLFNLVAYEVTDHEQANCTLANAAIRKEWYDARTQIWEKWLTGRPGRLCCPMRGKHIRTQSCV